MGLVAGADSLSQTASSVLSDFYRQRQCADAICVTVAQFYSLYRLHTAYTHTRLTALFLGLPWWAGTRKAKPNWILLKQETVSGSGISWAICKSAPRSRQITTPALHHSVFLQAGCPSCRPTNSVKALKASHCIHVQKSDLQLHLVTSAKF